jgi:hypothetical protein
MLFPFIVLCRDSDMLAGVYLQSGTNMWQVWSIRLCLSLFCWELCVGFRYKKLFP